MKKKFKNIIFLLIVILIPLQVGADVADCNSIFGGKFGDYLRDALKLVRFAVPIILIAFTIKDFFQCLASQDSDGLKKAISSFKTRAIIGVLIFFLPTIINFILDLTGIGADYKICRLAVNINAHT